MTPQTIPCWACRGKGTLKLSPQLQRVFDIIVKLGQPTCPEIFQKLKGHYTDKTVAPVYVKRLLRLGVIKKIVVNGERVPRYATA
jgi:hypothetical protein